MVVKLWKHQAYAIKKYAEREFFGLLFQCGMGKTLAAARIAEAKERPVLIIAPNCLCEQWKEELENHNDKRITTKDWDVVVCTSKTKKTKRFHEKFTALLKSVSEEN